MATAAATGERDKDSRHSFDERRTIRQGVYKGGRAGQQMDRKGRRLYEQSSRYRLSSRRRLK